MYSEYLLLFDVYSEYLLLFDVVSEFLLSFDVFSEDRRYSCSRTEFRPIQAEIIK